MRFYRFADGHSIKAASATEFFDAYAAMNENPHAGHLNTTNGGKTLLYLRAVFMIGTRNDLRIDMPDDEFLARCEEIGMFTTEAIDGLASTGEMQG